MMFRKTKSTFMILVVTGLIGVLCIGVSSALAEDLQGKWDAYWLINPELGPGGGEWTIYQDGVTLTLESSTGSTAIGVTNGESVVLTFPHIFCGGVTKTGITISNDSMAGVAVCADGTLEYSWMARKISKSVGNGR